LFRIVSEHSDKDGFVNTFKLIESGEGHSALGRAHA
jgi:hypothetical protein